MRLYLWLELNLRISGDNLYWCFWERSLEFLLSCTPPGITPCPSERGLRNEDGEGGRALAEVVQRGPVVPKLGNRYPNRLGTARSNLLRLARGLQGHLQVTHIWLGIALVLFDFSVGTGLGHTEEQRGAGRGLLLVQRCGTSWCGRTAPSSSSRRVSATSARAHPHAKDAFLAGSPIVSAGI